MKRARTVRACRSVILSESAPGSSTEYVPVPAGRHCEVTLPCARARRKPGRVK